MYIGCIKDTNRVRVNRFKNDYDISISIPVLLFEEGVTYIVDRVI